MTVNIARCPEHGLHGERTSCFVCGGEVEQVPLVSADEVLTLTEEERHRLLWWLYKPVPPGPMKELDVTIIRKLERAGGTP